MNSAILSIYKSEIVEKADHDVQVPARVLTVAKPPPRRPSQIPEEPSNTNPGKEKRSQDFGSA